MSAQPEYLDLQVVADRLAVPLQRLVALSRAKQFPPLLRIARGAYRVRTADFDRWVECNSLDVIDARVGMAKSLAKQGARR